jgi:hypothetical protein
LSISAFVGFLGILWKFEPSEKEKEIEKAASLEAALSI